MYIFFKFGNFPVKADQVQNDTGKYGHDHRYHHIDLSIAPHGIGHFYILALLCKHHEGSKQQGQ